MSEPTAVEIDYVESRLTTVEEKVAGIKARPDALDQDLEEVERLLGEVRELRATFDRVKSDYAAQEAGR